MTLVITDDTARTALHRLLAAELDLGTVARSLTAGAGERRWLEVEANERFDAWLIAWGVNSELAAHDHGGSTGVLHVLRGGLVEWYRDQGERAAWNVRELTPGRSITVPPARIHQIQQCGPETAVSLHVYSPPLRAMRAYPPVQSLGAP